MGTAYTYTVRANNGCALQTVTSPGTSATDLSSSIPSGFANNGAADVSACSATGNAVTWAAPSGWNDNGSGSRTYDVLRNGTPLAAGTGLSGAAVNFTDATAVVGTAYTYTVRANNGCALQTVTSPGTSATDLTGSVPSGLANNTAADLDACTASGNLISWTAPTAWGDNASGIRNWTVLRGGVALVSGPCSGALTEAALNCIDTTAANGTAYTYTLQANNGCALNTVTTGASATDNKDVTAPAWGVPSPLTIAKASPNMNFAWPSAEAGATYNTYTSTSAGPPVWGASVNSTTTLAWSDATDLGTATSVFFTTTAKDVCGNETTR